MDRRQLLTVAGSLVIAGCTSEAPEEDGGLTDSSGRNSSENGPSPSTNGNRENELAVETAVSDVSLGTREMGAGTTETAVTGLIENTGEARLGSVTATGKFYNSNDRLLSTSAWHIRDLEVGEIWEPWVKYIGEGDVDWAELAATNTIPHRRTVWPSGVEVTEKDIQIPTDDHASPRITGTVVNNSGSTIPILQARPKVVAKNGHLLETAIASVQNIGAGETWQIDMQVTFANTAWKERSSKYNIVLTG